MTNMEWPSPEEVAQYGRIERDWIDADTIQTTKYQRDLYPQHVNAICRKFRAALVNDPLVNRVGENGTRRYDAIDAQHTIDVLKRGGIEKIYCRIIQVSETEAAKIFGSQVAKSLRVAERFNAAINSGSELHITINQVINDHGMKVANRNDKREVPVIKSLHEIARLLDDFGIEHFATTMDFVNELWPFDNKRSSVYFLHGVADFLARYGDRVGDLQCDLLDDLSVDPYMQVGMTSQPGLRYQGISKALRKQAGFQTRGRPHDVAPEVNKPDDIAYFHNIVRN